MIARMPETSRMLDIAPGECAKAYQKLTKSYGVAISPSILAGLNKLDANEDPAKTRALVDGVVAAIVKWDATWSEEIKKVADPKAKALRAEFAVVMFKIKQVVQGDVRPSAGGSDKATPPA